MKRRLLAIAVAIPIAATSLFALPTASAVESQPGFFGATSLDPTYTGVLRQSMAILGLRSAYVTPPKASVKWLRNQQCNDGSFQAYVAPDASCIAPDPALFSGPDSDSTALAASALFEAGARKPASRAISALVREQNADGGWPWIFGDVSNLSSTALALQALNYTPKTKGVSAARAAGIAYLKAGMIPCSAPEAVRFAVPFAPGCDSPYQLATAYALMSAMTSPSTTIRKVGAVTCSSDYLRQIASYVDRSARGFSWSLENTYEPGTSDWNSTALAVVGLARAGYSTQAIKKMNETLAKKQNDYIYADGKQPNPAAVGTLILAAKAAGDAPRFYGPKQTDLIALLLKSMQK